MSAKAAAITQCNNSQTCSFMQHVFKIPGKRNSQNMLYFCLLESTNKSYAIKLEIRCHPFRNLQGGVTYFHFAYRAYKQIESSHQCFVCKLICQSIKSSSHNSLKSQLTQPDLLQTWGEVRAEA